MTVLVTGASSGIGLELAKIFAENNYDIVLVARNFDQLTTVAHELENTYHIKTFIIPKDLSDQNSGQQLYNEVKNLNLQIDVLVNNAGFATHGNFSDTDLDTEVEEINVNVMALTVLTKLYVREMKSRNSGKILNLASIVSFLPGPYMAVYYATKAYVLSLTEALTNELKGTNVTITALCPGVTNTNFFNRANMTQNKVIARGAMSPTTVARVGYKALMKGKIYVLPGLQNKLLIFFSRFAPVWFLLNFTRSIQKD